MRLLRVWLALRLPPQSELAGESACVRAALILAGLSAEDKARHQRGQARDAEAAPCVRGRQALALDADLSDSRARGQPHTASSLGRTSPYTPHPHPTRCTLHPHPTRCTLHLTIHAARCTPRPFHPSPSPEPRHSRMALTCARLCRVRGSRSSTLTSFARQWPLSSRSSTPPRTHAQTIPFGYGSCRWTQLIALLQSQ